MTRIGVGAVGLLATAAVAAAHGSGVARRPAPYSLAARQAQEVAVAIQFVNAFNAGNLRQALATFGPNAVGSDCDYRHVRVVQFKGRHEIAAWLRRRFADDDRLGMARAFNENAAQPVGVLGIEWPIRKNKTLRRLGFPHGIVPQGAAKVVFTRGFPPRIKAFANGPSGGDRSICRPR